MEIQKLNIDMKLLIKQKDYLIRHWNKMQEDPNGNKTDIQLNDGLVSFIYSILEEMKFNGESEPIVLKDSRE